MLHGVTKSRINIANHPCYSGSAGKRWGRIHLPVAPKCNIQCNYCNRCYDCANESRPAVTKLILEPHDAVSYLNAILKDQSDISVVGIAGPGDALCEPLRTLKTVRSVRKAHPDLLFCLSTNGLNLLEQIEDLAEAGVTHVTVTVNAVDPFVGAMIYSWVSFNGKVLRGYEAAELLINRQLEAIVRLKANGIEVKINTVVLPGVNVEHIQGIAKQVALLGADVMNCIPAIPVPDTPFEHLGTLSNSELSSVKTAASHYIPLIHHCQRCRADAAGLLNVETSASSARTRNALWY